MTKLDFSFEEVKAAVDSASSIKDFLIALNMKVNNGNYRRAAQICSDHGLEIPKHDYNSNGETLRSINRYTDSEFFCQGQLRNGPAIKKRLIEDHGHLDVCSECGQEPEWNGKPLTLQVDHIDGDRFNNLVDNLRILCGHCHSQTETYGYTSGREETYRYCICGVRIWKYSETCRGCSPKDNNLGFYKFDFPEIDGIIAKVQELGGWTAASRYFGIGDNTLRKHVRRNGIDPKTVKYTRRIAKLDTDDKSVVE